MRNPYYEVLLAQPAADVLRAVHDENPPLGRWLLDACELLTADREPREALAGAGERGVFRKRIGEYAALYWVRQEELTVIVLSIIRRPSS